ncbi:MAG: efflux RND transporter periplasmic adaptor subunit, partial [Planctomycetaceae bacterium]
QQQNLSRVQRLMSNNATTDTQLDAARIQELASRNALQGLENQLSTVRQRRNTLQAAKRLVQTALKRAEIDVARTRVSAPLSGTLVTVDVEEGDYVKAGDPLFSINDTGTMEVSCQLRVDELYWVWLQAGTFGARPETEAQPAPRQATFEIPNVAVEVAFPFRGTEYLWSGVLSRYDGTGLDPGTRTIPCRVRVDAPTDVRVGGNGVAGAVAPPTLFSGMYVKVRIPIDTPIPMLRIPLTGLRPGGKVWIARDEKLAIVPVEVARKDGKTALLLVKPGGPRPDDLVITSPLAAVEEGLPVRDIGAASEIASSAATEADAAQEADTASDIAHQEGAHDAGLSTEDQP